MLLTLEIPATETTYWLAQLEVLSRKPEITAPTLSPAEAEALRAAVAEVKAGRHNGPPLLTMEEFWASIHTKEDDGVDAKEA